MLKVLNFKLIFHPMFPTALFSPSVSPFVSLPGGSCWVSVITPFSHIERVKIRVYSTDDTRQCWLVSVVWWGACVCIRVCVYGCYLQKLFTNVWSGYLSSMITLSPLRKISWADSILTIISLLTIALTIWSHTLTVIFLLERTPEEHLFYTLSSILTTAYIIMSRR